MDYNKIETVDVEAIMAEIRKNIAARSDAEKILGFDENQADQECAAGVPGTEYTDSVLHQHIALASQQHNINFYQMIPKGGVKSFIKRSIRKLISPTVLPLRNAQNSFNAEVVQALMQLEAYTAPSSSLLDRQEELIEEMAKKIEELEKKIEVLESK